MKHEVNDLGKLIAYITDCNLATVSDMAMKKSRPKYEYERQIIIAQFSINKAIELGIEQRTFLTTRAYEVINSFEGNVTEWAKQYEVNKK
jgi:hypothetical protein